MSGLASTRGQLNTYMCSTFMAVSTAEDVTHAITAECVAFLLDNEFINVQQVTEGGGWYFLFVCLGHALCMQDNFVDPSLSVSFRRDTKSRPFYICQGK